MAFIDLLRKPFSVLQLMAKGGEEEVPLPSLDGPSPQVNMLRVLAGSTGMVPLRLILRSHDFYRVRCLPRTTEA